MELLQPQWFWPMCLFSFVTSVTPGPNNMMLLASGVNFGLRATLRHWLGISVGLLVMLVAVGMGLAEVFTRFPLAHTVMRWGGMAYMAYLAVKIACSRVSTSDDAQRAQPMGFFAAAAFQAVNPKCWVMAVGYFSAYVPSGHGVGYIALAAVLFACINFPSCGSWIVLGQSLRHMLSKPAQQRSFNIVMGVLLLGSTVSMAWA